MASPSWYSLATFQDISGFLLESDANDTLSEKVYTDGGEFDNQGVSSLHTASSMVKRYLNRGILVDQYVPLLKREDWDKVTKTPDDNYPYKLNINLISDWPIIKVTEDVKLHQERKVFAKDFSFNTIEYWAGYRREDQDLSNYPSEVSNNVTESEVDVLPQIIQDVTMRIALHRANRQLKGLIGISRIKQMFGDFAGESEKEMADERYENIQLNRLHDFRFLT